ncbi:MAG: ATP-dependent DNA ligase, partial [uncultured Nocardioides sp.]
GVPVRRDRGRGPRRQGDQPRPGLLPRVRRDEARPRRVLPVRRRRHRQRAVRASVHAPPVPEGAGRREGAPEARPRRRAPVAGDRPPALPAVEPDGRRAVRHRARERGVGRADVDGGVPPVEQPTRRHREARRVAHRPRSRTAVRLGAGPSGHPRRAGGPRRARRRRPPQDQRQQGSPRLRPDPARARVPRRTTCRARLRPRDRAPGAGRRHDGVVDQEPGPPPPLRRLQPEHPRPHHRRRLLRPRPARRARLDAGALGGGRRRRAAGLHDLHRPGALRRDRRPARRHRPAPLRHRPAAGVGRPRRGGGRPARGARRGGL